jgi:hypothetical protein
VVGRARAKGGSDSGSVACPRFRTGTDELPASPHSDASPTHHFVNMLLLIPVRSIPTIKSGIVLLPTMMTSSLDLLEV